MNLQRLTVRRNRDIRGAVIIVSILAVLSFAFMVWVIDSLPGATPSWVPAGVPACATEDAAGPCYWDATSRGNGDGESFWIDADGTWHPADDEVQR